jgi:hypothetical protein
MKTVKPTKVSIQPRYVWQKPSVTFTCGHCGLNNLAKKIDIIKNPPTICKYCSAINILPIEPED